MFNKSKKGFTLVELLVVIAILAILTTVSIVGYTTFIAKANLSNDQATISMINRNLQAEWLTDKPESAAEAYASLYSLGFSSEKLVPYSGGFHYVYDLNANQMYLFDKNDNLIYPENVTATGADLWTQYTGRADDVVDGVTNYIAMQPVTKSSANFELVFASGSYKLDLNNFYLDRPMHAGVEITVLNGAITPGSTGFTAGEGTTELTLATKPADTVVNVTIENQIIDRATLTSVQRNDGSVTIKNCLIIGDPKSPSGSFSVGGKSVTIEGCTFTGFGKFSLTINSPQEEGYTVVVKNNLFINTSRGINFYFGYDSATFEGNTFNLGIDAKSNAVQLVLRDSEHTVVQDSTGLKAGSVVFKNNNFESCNAAVVLHSGLVANLSIDETDQLKTVAEWRNAIVNAVAFENNTFGELGSGEKVIADPDAATELKTDEHRQTMLDLIELFQQKVR